MTATTEDHQIVTYVVEVDCAEFLTPLVMEVPTTLGPDAAKRRAQMSAFHLYKLDSLLLDCTVTVTGTA